MQWGSYHGSSESSCLVLAADELRRIADLEFLLNSDSAEGIALSQLALYLLRIDQGVPPFPHGARAFLDAIYTRSSGPGGRPVAANELT